MARTTSPLLPTTDRLLAQLGERLRLARLRRRLSATHVAERAGMAPKTLAAVERGASGATIGAYAAVLQVLQLEGSLDLVAADDALGRALQDATATSTRARRHARRTIGPRALTDAHAQAGTPVPETPSMASDQGVSTDTLLELLRSNEPSK